MFAEPGQGRQASSTDVLRPLKAVWSLFSQTSPLRIRAVRMTKSKGFKVLESHQGLTECAMSDRADGISNERSRTCGMQLGG